MDRTVDLGTDIAHFFVFHPDDLADHADDPIYWYAYAFACRPEFEAGNLLGFATGREGGYRFRFTDGALTDAEKAAEAATWEFEFVVRHGRVLLDNGDHLPSDQARKWGKQAVWIKIPDGTYRVTVHALDPGDAAGKEARELPNYVLRWEETDREPATLVRSPPRQSSNRGGEHHRLRSKACP